MRQDPEYDIDPRDEEFVHISELEKYEDVSEWLKKLLHCVYVDGDMTGLEDSLGELCETFGLKLPSGIPVLTKRSARNALSQDMFDLGADLIKLQGEI